MFFFKLPVKILLLVLAATAATILWQRAQLAALALVHVNPVPETKALVGEQRYAEAATYLDFFMAYAYVQDNPEAQALHADIQAKRNDRSYQAEKLYDGLIKGTSDEVIGQTAGVLTDFFVIGDIRDLVYQGTKALNGEEVDEVLVALATVGVVASTAQAVSSVATVSTAGAAAPTVAASTAVKGGSVILKVARKLGKLPAWLTKAIIAGADTVKKTKKLDSVTELFGDVFSLAKIKGGVTLLDKTTDAASLRKMARAADLYGDQTPTLYRMGGDTFLTMAQKTAELGADTIKLAATFGQNGLKLLDNIGALKFVKYTARGSKMIYKGDIINLLARLLSLIPEFILYLLMAAATVVWLPWKYLSSLIARLGMPVGYKH